MGSCLSSPTTIITITTAPFLTASLTRGLIYVNPSKTYISLSPLLIHYHYYYHHHHHHHHYTGRLYTRTMAAAASSSLSRRQPRADVSSSKPPPPSPSYSDVSPATARSSAASGFPPLRPCRKAAVTSRPPLVRQDNQSSSSSSRQQKEMERRMDQDRERAMRNRRHFEDEPEQFHVRPHNDIPPTVTITPSPSSSSSSVNTYDSSLSLDDYEEGDEVFEPSSSSEASSTTSRHRLFPFLSTAAAADDAAIPSALPAYRRASVSGGSDPASCFLRPSTPHAFGRLFPSLDRLSVRHDDLTPDGNMNLRVDTPLIPGGRRPVQFQLFHLRMHDLARREFSLRRYCRDSGREVCNSKREYALPTPAQRSVSSAIRTVKSPFRRESHGSAEHRRSGHSVTSSIFGSKNRRQSSGSSGTAASTASSVTGGGAAPSWWDHPSPDGATRPPTARRPSVVSTTGSVSASSSSPGVGGSSSSRPAPKPRPVPTNTIKLEFSNYARVDIARRGAKGHYDFEWWGHRYTWRRVVDKDLGGVASFHLVRDGRSNAPVAHVVPEVRSPTQIDADEQAGGWVPPCYLWISDQSIIDAATDVADVIVATGLIALVDDSIKERWPGKKPAAARRNSLKLNHDDGAKLLRPRAFINSIFQRRHSEQYARSPLRAVAAH
ncbi:hypothetical protein HJFPF1_09300 [Paramyrothecium foliicola]|nr:hypothetical protein HJFPF1_09300 [Paramyrothecium foliicola]